jgi:putative FmdB family regulatory protein
MPTYAYTCRDCGSKLEVHQSFTDASLTVCPTCGGELRKQYGTVGVTFNGSGFYRTDSRAKDGGSSSGSDSSGTSSAAKSEGSSAPKESTKPSTESKPAAKPAASPAS